MKEYPSSLKKCEEKGFSHRPDSVSVGSQRTDFTQVGPRQTDRYRVGIQTTDTVTVTTSTNEEEDIYPETQELIEEDYRLQDESKAIIEVQDFQEIEPCKVDTGHFFITSKSFKGEADGVEWLMSVARSHNIILIRGRSDYSERRNLYVKYFCERGGHIRSLKKSYSKKTKGEGKGKSRSSMSKKCGCEFLLLLRKDKKEDCWKLTVKNGHHNHSLNRSSMGHSMLGRLNSEETDLVSRMTKSGVMPKIIQKELKEINPSNSTSSQTICNERVKLKKMLRQNCTVMQEVFYQARKSDVFTRYTHCDDVVENLFWAGMKSLMLANKFPYVLMMDCTYKTNFYKLHLLQIVGVSSTNLTFSIAFAYLSTEKKENYEWALRQLKEALMETANLVQVIITDRELALMDVIQLVFPQASHLLCRWHIEKAIKAHIRKGITEVQCDDIIGLWKNVVYSETEEQLAMILEVCKETLSVDTFKYMESSWLTPYKEKFVSLWTNKVFHLGNTQTSRVEGAHAALKNWLGTANCDMVAGWSAITSLCDQQFSNIEASFEISKTKWSITTFGDKWSRYLRGVVSLDGLKLIKQELVWVKDVGMDQGKCGCVLRQTHGLPCAHEIATIMRDREFIPRSLVHVHWKSLSLDDQVVMDDESLDPHPHIEAFLKVFESSTKTQQFELIQRLREVTEPECTMLSQPLKKLNPRGRPKKRKARKVDEYSTKRDPSLFEYVEITASYKESQSRKEVKGKKQKLVVKRAKASKDTCTPDSYSIEAVKLVAIHSGFRSFVDEIIDVKADGNCGFRVVGVALGMNEEEWPIIRQQLCEELQSDVEHYDNVFKLKGYTEKLIEEVHWLSGSCRQKHWMTTPAILWPITERYNVGISIFSQTNGGILTCFPLKRPPMTDEPPHISIVVRDSHYKCVKLKSNCPLPPLLVRWKELTSLEHRETLWQKFGPRIEEGARIIPLEDPSAVDITTP